MFMPWLLMIGFVIAVTMAIVLSAQMPPTVFPLAGGTILNTKPNRIDIKTSGRREEGVASAAGFYPGSLMQMQSDGTVVPHATMGGVAEIIFALEDIYQGKWFFDAYAVNDVVPLMFPRHGDVIIGLVPPGAPSIAIADNIISNGDGQVRGAFGNGLGAPLFQNAADSTAVASTATETIFDVKYKIPANTLQVGDVIKVKGLVSGIGVTATPTLQIKLQLLDDAGSPTTITVMDTSTISVIASDIGEFEALIVIRTIGVAGTMVATGTFDVGTSGTATGKAWSKASTTIKTNQAQTVQVSATWSASSASNTCLLRILNVELGRPMASIGKAMLAVDNSLGTVFAYLPIRTR